jgi:catechol 2,3-dioxygenase-like lactoylglutathione lyase family enzyme
MSVRPRGIGHVGLIARDLDRFVAFYERVLGFRVSDWMTFPPGSPYDVGVWLRCNNDHHVLSVFSTKAPAPEGPSAARGGYPGLHHLGFEMASFEDLQRATRLVSEAGIEVQGMRSGGPGVQLRLYFWDPEDNIVELYWAMDQIGWDAETREYPPVVNVDLLTFDVDAWLEMKGSEFTR